MMTWNSLFKTKNRVYFGLVCAGVAVMLGVASKQQNPIMRQPLSVGAVQTLTKPFQIKKSMASARKSAERLDHQASHLMNVTFMSSWARWRAGIDIDDLHEQFSRDLTSHLQSMTKLMRFRREFGGQYKKLQEFDFQNLARKSDYLLGLSITKAHLEAMQSADSDITREFIKERASFNSQNVAVVQQGRNFL